MTDISKEKLQSYRENSFHLSPSERVKTFRDAIRFINQRGFVFFWPIKGITMPSLWTANAGDRPVPNEHDDPGMVTWRWKDDALDKKVWYYAKILRRKATFIALDKVPYFYALSENYGSLEEDFLDLYRDGKLTQAAKNVYEGLLEKGPLDTIALRREAHLINAKESAFTRALEDLQMDFKILPVGIAEVGSWKYAFRYDITSRYFPDLPQKSRNITESQARQKLVELYFLSVGASTASDVARLFGWSDDVVDSALSQLVKKGLLIKGLEMPGQKDEWFSIPGLI